MRAYDLTIQSPKPATFIVTAHDDEAAANLTRESLLIDYADERDPAVLASRVSLVARVGGQAVFEAALVEMLTPTGTEPKASEGAIALAGA